VRTLRAFRILIPPFGLGGGGKIQTAVEYAHCHLEEYDNAFWSTADSVEIVASDYATIAGILKLSAAGVQDQTCVVDAVKRWLGSHRSWLLILDNADDLEMMRAFIPPGKNETQRFYDLSLRRCGFDLVDLIKGQAERTLLDELKPSGEAAQSVQ
jgi:hypothetical protein